MEESEGAPYSFFWMVVWGVVAVSNIIRWPIGAIVFFGGAVAWFWDGNIFWGIVWLTILGYIVSGIVMLLTAIPFFILGVMLASVLVAIRWLFRMEKAAIKGLPIEIRKKKP